MQPSGPKFGISPEPPPQPLLLHAARTVRLRSGQAARKRRGSEPRKDTILVRSVRTALVVLCISAVAGASAQVSWSTTFATAIKKASASGKPIFVDFYATWCGPCKMLEETFADTRVKGLLQQTTCLRIDVDQNQGDALRFKVSSIPRLLVLSPDGRKVLWDGVGYRDPDTFAPELSEALHVKTPVAAAPISTPEPPALASVDAAVEKGVLAQLKVNHPEVAKEGLRLLVQKLGVYKESDLAPVAAMLEKAGRDALPALVDGMADKTLAVRVGAYKVAQAILAKTGQKPPPYDPWAPVSTRISALGIWRAKLSS